MMNASARLMCLRPIGVGVVCLVTPMVGRGPEWRSGWRVGAAGSGVPVAGHRIGFGGRPLRHADRSRPRLCRWPLIPTVGEGTSD